MIDSEVFIVHDDNDLVFAIAPSDYVDEADPDEGYADVRCWCAVQLPNRDERHDACLVGTVTCHGEDRFLGLCGACVDVLVDASAEVRCAKCASRPVLSSVRLLGDDEFPDPRQVLDTMEHDDGPRMIEGRWWVEGTGPTEPTE